jgi:glycosyltransferase involved in cell wall biosynthesis
MGARIYIYDDQSDDPETIQVLDRLSRKHPVIAADPNISDKHGGLHANMQAAFEAMPDDEFFCFIQDDMQVVRPITSSDIDYVHDFYDRFPDAGFLHPGFLKGCNRKRDKALMRYDPSMKIYFRRQNRNSAGTYYSDIMISNAGRLRSRGWRFDRREAAGETHARAVFTKMGFMFTPFVMWLPSVPAYRGKKKTFALKYSEKFDKAGYYPFSDMTEADVARLEKRDASVLPIAEDFLTCADPGIEKPWAYYPLQKRRLLKLMDRIEMLLTS